MSSASANVAEGLKYFSFAGLSDFKRNNEKIELEENEPPKKLRKAEPSIPGVSKLTGKKSRLPEIIRIYTDDQKMILTTSQLLCYGLKENTVCKEVGKVDTFNRYCRRNDIEYPIKLVDFWNFIMLLIHSEYSESAVQIYQSVLLKHLILGDHFKPDPMLPTKIIYLRRQVAWCLNRSAPEKARPADPGLKKLHLLSEEQRRVFLFWTAPGLRFNSFIGIGPDDTRIKNSERFGRIEKNKLDKFRVIKIACTGGPSKPKNKIKIQLQRNCKIQEDSLKNWSDENLENIECKFRFCMVHDSVPMRKQR